MSKSVHVHYMCNQKHLGFIALLGTNIDEHFPTHAPHVFLQGWDLIAMHAYQYVHYKCNLERLSYYCNTHTNIIERFYATHALRDYAKQKFLHSKTMVFESYEDWILIVEQREADVFFFFQ